MNEWKSTPWGKIPASWGITTIDEASELVTDYTSNGSFKSLADNVKYYDKPEYAWMVRYTDFSKGFVGPFIFIDKNAYDFLSKTKLYGNEILISNVGIIGGVFRCPRLYSKMSLAPNSILVKFKESDDFYYYWLKSIYGQFMMDSLTIGSVQKKLSKTNFRKMLVPVPPISTQNKIAEILQSIDDKISVNSAINQNLQEQAKALYSDMIVDKADGTWIPGTLSDVAIVTMGQSPKGDTYNEDGTGTVFFQGRAEFGFRFPTRRLYTTEPKRMAQSNDALMSVRAPVGDMNVAYEDCCIGRGLSAIRSKDGHQSYVLYTMFDLREQLDVFNGEGTVFGSINRDALNNMPISIPPKNVLDQFEALVSPMDAAIRNNFEEICRLESLRDSLLPRLMSGELDVSEIDL